MRFDTMTLHHLCLTASLALTTTALGCGTTPAETEGSASGTSTGSTSTGSTSTSTLDTTDGSSSGEAAATTEESSTSSGSTSAATTGGESTTEETTTTGGETPVMGFFVSSTGSKSGNLGGLAGADQRCQDLAEKVGAGARTWHAYLSAEKGDDDQPVHARDRIGQGPWYNAALVLLAADLDELHALDGDHTLFLDEQGEMVNGQWEDSPDPNEHDVLTGSNRDGTLLAEKTCADWTSEDPALFAQVGHSDGLGPMMSDAEMYRPWNSVHESGGCHDTAPKGGAGRIYCFAVD